MSSNNPRQNSTASGMGKLMEKIKKMGVDESRPPAHHGYQRVEREDGTFSTSDTSTSLDKVLIDIETDPLANQPTTSLSLPQKQRSFGNPNTSPATTTGDATVRIQLPKSALKTSKVSFERDTYSSDEEDLPGRRLHFQGKGAQKSDIDHKSILKDLKNILDDENRRDFQSKKHVSLDLKHTRFLENILKNSSSEEEDNFEEQRKHFQARKHQSLDPKVTFKLDKDKELGATSDDEFVRPEVRRLIRRQGHDSNSIIIDLKDFQNILQEAAEEVEEEEDDEDEETDEDLVETRRNFQAQKSMSTDSRRSYRFFEMDDLNGKKGDNLRNSVPFVRQITEDGKPMLEIYRPTTNPIYIYTQILAALSVSLGSLVVGFSSAYTSPAMVSLTDRNQTSFGVSVEEVSWMGGIMPLAALVGSFVGGPMLEYLGRRNTIITTALPFVAAWLFIAMATNSTLILVGRGISGFCVGIASLSLPVYLGETVQPEVRGTLGLLPTAFGNIGILLAYAAGYGMNWSELAYLGASLPIPFLVLMFFIPETPRWFVSRGKEPQARKALQWLRGREADIEPELKGIMKSHAEAERHQSQNIARELLQRNNLKPLAISLGLMLFQQFSGINAVIFYAQSIFKESGTSMNDSEGTIIIGCVNFIATFVATLLIDRLGRKILLYISSVVMVISLALLGTFFYYKNMGADVSAYDVMPLICLMGYVTAFSLGFGPIPWLMMGEILPGKIRGSAASVATAFNWTCTFIVTKTFPVLLDVIKSHGTFWAFAVIVCISLVFVVFCVPETQGKTLEDIERTMNGRVRRMSSVANMKPLSFNM